MEFLPRVLTAFSLLACLHADRVIFTNGDQLTGRLLPVGSQGAVQWEAEAFTQPVELSTELLHTVHLEQARPPSESKGYVVEVSMNRGDLFTGTLIGLSEKEIILSTSYSDELVLERRFIKSIELYDQREVSFRGPGELSDWTTIGERKAWQQADDAFVSIGRGAICREVKHLKRSHLSFDLKWQNYPRLKLFLNASEGKSYDPNRFLEVGINRRSITARLRHNGETFNIGQKHGLKPLAEKESASFDFYYDETTLIVVLDEVEVARWILPEKMASIRGNWLYLNAEYSETLTLSKLQLKAWNGEKQPALPSLDSATSEAGDHLIILKNGDPVTGTIEGFKENSLQVETEFGDLTLPLQRVREIASTTQDYEEARRNRGDLTLYFHNGAIVTLQPLQWRDSEVIGRSQNFSENRFSLSSIRKIRFNIYDL